MLYNEKINLPESIQIGRIPQSWSCERENTESENMLYMNILSPPHLLLESSIKWVGEPMANLK